MSKESIERLRAKRGGYRGVVTKLVKEAQELLLSSEVDIQVIERCEIISGQLETRMNILNGINEEILGLCEVSEIGDEIEEAAVVLDRILNVKGKIEAAKRKKKAVSTLVAQHHRSQALILKSKTTLVRTKTQVIQRRIVMVVYSATHDISFM